MTAVVSQFARGFVKKTTPDEMGLTPSSKKPRVLAMASSDEGAKHESKVFVSPKVCLKDYISAGNQVMKCLRYQERADKFSQKEWPDGFVKQMAQNTGKETILKVMHKNFGNEFYNDTKISKKEMVTDLLNWALGLNVVPRK